MLSPVALLPDAATDDGAGDALTPQAEAEMYLPCPPSSRTSGSSPRPGRSAGSPATRTTRERARSGARRAGPGARLAARRRGIPRPTRLRVSTCSQPQPSPIANVARPATDTRSGYRPRRRAGCRPARRPRQPAGSCPALLQRTFNRLQTGKPESLCQFDGKVLLIVNTASYCGYTHQFEGLEAMYRQVQGPRARRRRLPVERLRQAGAGHQRARSPSSAGSRTASSSRCSRSRA